MTNAVTTAVFGEAPTSISIAEYVFLCPPLSVDSRYLTTDDHALEAMIVEAFPFLKAITKNQPGKLIEHVIENVLNDRPDLMPKEVEYVLEDLLTRPPHC